MGPNVGRLKKKKASCEDGTRKSVLLSVCHKLCSGGGGRLAQLESPEKGV